MWVLGTVSGSSVKATSTLNHPVMSPALSSSNSVSSQGFIYHLYLTHSIPTSTLVHFYCLQSTSYSTSICTAHTHLEASPDLFHRCLTSGPTAIIQCPSGFSHHKDISLSGFRQNKCLASSFSPSSLCVCDWEQQGLNPGLMHRRQGLYQ